MKHARLASSALRLGTVLALLSAAFPAGAWDRDQHVAIARAALGISAAAEEHLPLEFRDAMFREIAEPDYVDKDCRYHPSDTGAKEAALVAEQLLGQILTPRAPLKPYVRSQLVGRYLHYVMDAVAPPELRRENAPKLVNFFANRDFIFFREKRGALGPPVAAGLRKRAEEMVWANVNLESAYAPMFRCVVNATADAMLLLPLREGATARDEGPVYFLVNRVDSGTAGKEIKGHYEASSTSGWRTITTGPYTFDVHGTWTTYEWVSGQKGGGDSFKKLDLMERRGAQLVELVARQEKDRVILRGMFFNNHEICSEGIGLKAGAWSWALNETMPPHSVRTFEAIAPADLLARRITNGYRSTACEGAKAGSSLSAANRVVIGNGGDTPRFEYAAQPIDLSTKSKTTTTNLTPKN